MPHGDTPPQYLRRLAEPVFIPLGGPSIYAAWRAQCFRRLARPVFTPLGDPSVFAAWRAQCFRRLAGPVFSPLGARCLLLKKRRLDAGGVYGR